MDRRALIAVLLLVACQSRDRECTEAPSCELDGLCAHDGERCVASDPEQCRRSMSCRVHGRCTIDQGECVVASDADCAGSEVCKEHNSCQRIIGWDGSAVCVPPCRVREPCRAAGFCERIGEHCLPASDEDCRRSVACRTDGRCTRNDEGVCELLGDADCRRTDACKESGKCTYRHGECVGDSK